MIDINDQKKRTQALQLKAEMDLHSGVYNKKTTEQLVEQYLMEGDEGLHNAMMIIDIDNFKLINDRFGHATGDQVISDVAYKLKEIMRSSDIIGRVGGDEFMIFIKSMSSEQAIFKKAKDICCMFKDIKIKAAPNYKVSGSVGISIYKKDGTTYHELYNKADLALYRSKNQGKDRFCFYNEKEDKRTFDCVESES
jgi:diguanylate cyclase (GGDEF)-like protein